MSISRRPLKKALLAAAGAALVVAPTAVAPTAQASTLTATVTVIASNLNNPRGITLPNDGSILVAESGNGNGNCTVGATCFGMTGSIFKVAVDGTQSRPVTGLPSMAKVYTAGGAVVSSGPFQVRKDPGGGYDVLSSFGGTDTTRAALGPGAAPLGTAYRTRDGVILHDLVDWVTTNNPNPNQPTWSNPYRFLQVGADYLITDAAENVVLRDHSNGTTTTEWVIPTNTNPATGASVHAVVTGIAEASDGTIYLADMSGEVTGLARIWKVAPGGTPQVLATGMSNLIDLAIDNSGNLLALGYSNSYPTGPGQLYQVDPNSGAVTTIDTGSQLTHPTGIAVSSTGTVYVTNNGGGTSGQLVQVSY